MVRRMTRDPVELAADIILGAVEIAAAVLFFAFCGTVWAIVA